MAAVGAPLYESLLNHLVLNPCPPGRQDARLDLIERAIIERVLDATNRLSRVPDNLHVDTLQSLRRSIEVCKRVNTGGRLSRLSLLTAFRDLNGDDMIIVHVSEQNSGLLIRRDADNTQRVIIEAFEASPLSEEVLTAKTALQWDFPGSAVALPLPTFQDPSFQEELATFLEKASTESIKRFAARTNKAGSFAFESRDTVDPALITQMLMTLLATLGTKVYPKILRKRVRDDVSWAQGAQLPWRRCPFWLVLRVGIQRHLSLALGGEIGRLHYKLLVILVMSRLLDESLLLISLDLSTLLKTKICRRVVKLGVDKENSNPSIRAEYERMFTGLMTDLERSTSQATGQINQAWASFKRRILRPVLTLQTRAEREPGSLQLTLPNSQCYLTQLLTQPLALGTVAQPLFHTLPTDFQALTAAAKAGVQFAEKCFRLSQLEIEIKDKCSAVRPFGDDEKECINFSRDIEHYLNQIGDSYNQNPEQMSTMLLTVMELWMLMDGAAIGAYPLLTDFNPGFPSSILDVLQIAKSEDMSCLLNIRKYITKRHSLCNGSKKTIFVDPEKDCFAERYFNESPDSMRLQALHTKIELDAAEDRQEKEDEWQGKTREFQELVKESSEASCIYETNEYGVRSHVRHCRKCSLDRKVSNFRMVAYEYPLPTDTIQAKAVVFELGCPRAFAVYRDSTWRILSSLALQADPASHEPRLILRDYSQLTTYGGPVLRKSTFTLASTTKSFLQTHYARPSFPVGLDDVCLPNGLKLGYWDTHQKLWPSRILQRPRFAHHVPLALPSSSPLAHLNSLAAFAADSKGPTSYEIISSQTKCPPGLNVHEYLSFQALFSGKTRRWPQILVELGSSNMNFSTEATAALMSLLTLQAGAADEDDTLGVVHCTARDERFCRRLLEQLDHRLDGISFNWRETNSMETLITIAIWLFEFGTVTRPSALDLIFKARRVTASWIDALKLDMRKSTDAVAIRTCSRYLFWAALLCRRTFGVHENPEVMLNAEALTQYIYCSISLQDNLVADPASLPTVLNNALVRDLKMAHRLRGRLGAALGANKSCLPAAVTSIWPNSQESDGRKFSDIKFLPAPCHCWMRMTVAASSFARLQVVHFHILEGHLLVDSKPIGKLPPEWRQELVLKQLFGNQSLQTYPSSMPGMSYMLASLVNQHHVHIGFREGRLIVRAVYLNRVLELIPIHVFGDIANFDLPAQLVENCTHWLDLQSGDIEIRNAPNIWKSKPSNWKLIFSQRRATRCHHGRTSDLVDPQSPLFQRIARIFEHFEARKHLTVFQPTKGNMVVDLSRLALSFIVNGRGLLESQQLKAEIDHNQDAGTWYGLNSKLVLKEVVIEKDPKTNYITSKPQQQRIILVPMGEIICSRNESHVSVIVHNNADYAKYTINEVLKRLECPAEPTLLYLKAQFHAYTSSFMPDPLTGRTGSEEAIHCLRSGYCQPWSPLSMGPRRALANIARLTPHREYYPKGMRVMQTTTWDPQLINAIQHDGYRTLVDEILGKSDEISIFSAERIEVHPQVPKGDSHLTSRSILRRQLYQRPDAWLETFPDQEYKYQSRDQWRASQSNSNVSECVALLHVWPANFSTTSDFAGMLQAWSSIGGFNGEFQKVLLTDILDASLDAEWGSLVNLCRNSSGSHAYRLMFLFACMAFRHDANIVALRTLISFAIFSDLKALHPPEHPIFTQFRYNQAPRADYLVQLMKPHLIPYPGDERSTFGFALKHKQRKQLEAQELKHEEKQDSDAKILAEYFFKQWPCAEPQCAGFSTPVLVDIDQALNTIRPEWLRLFQNLELSGYVSWVQPILNTHSSGTYAHSPIQPVTGNVEPAIFATPLRGGEFPTVQNLLRRAVELTPASNHYTPLKPPPHPLQERCQNALGPRLTHTKAFNNTQYVQQKRQEPSEFRELDQFIRLAGGSSSGVEQQYADDLAQSLKALREVTALNSSQQKQPARNALSQATRLAQARSLVQKLWKELHDSFEQGYAARWLQQGDLWPATTPTSLLENLRSTSSLKFGSGMKDKLIEYAVAITAVQRMCRISEAEQKHNTQRVDEENNNTGHTNWEPADYPDWLLLQIDSNMLIRPGQVDVAKATISPHSGSNSVLQMNMGQGKTSCVIPMAAAILADGTNLHRIVVPKPLLLQTAQLLHARLGGMLGRQLRHVPFSRKTPTNSTTIELFLKLHKDMQRSSGVMLALPEHILSFMLSGLQRLSDGRNNEAATMIKVQNWISRKSRDVLDECDNILALRTQLIYPSGSQKTVNGHPHRWVVAEALLSQVNAHLHNLQQKFPRSIEVIRRGQGGFPVLFFLRKDVEDELIKRLVDDVYHGRTTLLPSDCTKEQRTLIKHFISEAKVDPNISASIHEIFPEKPEFRRVVYLLRGLLVYRILLMTLKKRWNVQYGLHPNRDPIAVPYHAKGTPSDQAEWGHPDVAILFTCLAFYYEGLNLRHLRQTIGHVLKLDDPSVMYEKFVCASQLPDSLKEWSAINIGDDAQLKELLKHLRYNVSVVDHFLNNFVFPKHAKQFSVKLQASGWDIPLFQARTPDVAASRRPLTTGFSGTNDWKRMLPLTITQQDLPGLSHTNAEVLTYLLQSRNRKYVIAASKDRHISEHELLRMINKEKIRVLIDAGAQILAMDNLSLVKAWLDINEEAPAAVFFNKENKPIVFYRQGHQVPLLATPFADDLSTVLVYLDEAHTRGTDLKMPPDARGALTLGLGQTKDATVQAAMRLRQLGTTQSITFFAPPEVHHSILDLRKKSSSDLIDSFDVICWLIEQTCSGIEQLQPLFFSQGADFCRRTQAVLDNPEFLTDEEQRESCLQLLRQVEQQTLEQLYGPNAKTKTITSSAAQAPPMQAFTKELMQRRKGFRDTGNAVHGSALQEVEQEREVAYEVEAVREVQKPVHYNPYGFPGRLHRDLETFAITGRMPADSAGYMQAFAAIRMHALAKKHPINLDATSNRLYVSTEFTKTVHAPTARIYDQFQRPVNWILWSSISEVAIIVIPEEAELLLQLVKNSESKATYLLTYAAPITRKMVALFNDLTYYTVPSLPADWKAPLWLRIELGIFAGRLYFDYDEYVHVLEFFGVKDEMGKHDEELEDADVANEMEIEVAEVVEISKNDVLDEAFSARFEEEASGNALEDTILVTVPEKRKPLTRRPLAFMAEWLSIHRKGQDITETPMGFICAGKQLHENHPFFLRPEHEQTRRGISSAQIGSDNAEDEEDEEEKEIGADNVYDNVYQEEDISDDSELQDDKMKDE